METNKEQNQENLSGQVDWDAMGKIFAGDQPEIRSDDKQEDPNAEEKEDETKTDDAAGAAEESNKTVEESTTETPSFDFNKYLAENSEGLFQSEDDFKSSLTKVKEFDAVKAELDQVKAEKETLFANPFIKTLNEMHKNNATPEQIKEFTNLYELGDMSKLDPKEALVQELIRNGTSRTMAERIIERKYSLDLSLDEEVLSTEEVSRNKESIELGKEQMRLDAQPVIASFKEKFDSLSQTTTAAADKQIDVIAAEKKYVESLKVPAEKLANSIPEKFKVGELSFDRGENFKKEFQEDFIGYFKDRKVDNESVKEFYEMKEAIFLKENFNSIKDAIEKDAYARGKKEAESEFENNSGLPRENVQTMTDSQKEQYDNFLRGLAQI